MYIDVGLGFHAQMTLEEAVQFGEAREARLMAQVEDLSGRAAELKAKIKIAVGAIDEVRCRPYASPPPFLTLAPVFQCMAGHCHSAQMSNPTTASHAVVRPFPCAGFGEGDVTRTLAYSSRAVDEVGGGAVPIRVVQGYPGWGTPPVVMTWVHAQAGREHEQTAASHSLLCACVTRTRHPVRLSPHCTRADAQVVDCCRLVAACPLAARRPRHTTRPPAHNLPPSLPDSQPYHDISTPTP